MKNKLIIGVLTLLILSSAIVITFQDNLRIEVERDSTQFKVPREDIPWFWKIAGEEENRLFDGTSIMKRDLDSINIYKKINNETQEVWITRETKYARGQIIKDIYYFRGDVEDVELFPISHKVRILNASGKYYRYTVDNLDDTGEKRKFENQTEFEFGNNMKVEVDEGYRWAWIGWPYGDDSFSAQYDIKSDNETFNVRLFDPEDWWDEDYDKRYKHNDNNSDWTGIGYFGTNKSNWYGTINGSTNGQVYTYEDTENNNFSVANDTTELCWFNTQTEKSYCSNPPKELISYWTLDTSGTYDYISENHGTRYGEVTYDVEGKVNDSYEFDGSNDYIEIEDEDSLDMDSEVTISAWVYADTTSGYDVIVSKRNQWEQNTNYQFFTYDGELRFFYGSGIFSGYTINTGEWYHVVVTVKDSSDETKFYVNGNLESTKSDSVSLDPNNAILQIGEGYGNAPWDGKIDDVRIYNRTLSATEIQNLYNSTNDKFPYWGETESVEYDRWILNSPENDSLQSGTANLDIEANDPDGDDMDLTLYNGKKSDLGVMCDTSDDDC
ncbi:MAG: LamG domain-containing protein, partial [Elusimicrobiota bacterium]